MSLLLRTITCNLATPTKSAYARIKIQNFIFNSLSIRVIQCSFSLFANRKYNIVKSPFFDAVIPSGNYIDYVLPKNKIEEHGKKVAIIEWPTQQSYTYDELHSKRKSVASGLNKNGVQKGDVISLVSNNCPEFLFAYHGIMSTGAIVNLVNPGSSVMELTHVLQTANPKIIISHASCISNIFQVANSLSNLKQVYFIGKLTETTSKCLPFADLESDDGYADPIDDVKIDKEDIAILPFSSGTTGLAKGVMLTHQNITANLVQSGSSFFDLQLTNHVALCVLPLYHIYGIICIAGCILKAGGTLVLMPKFIPEDYLQIIEKYSVNILHLVPPMILFLLHSPLVKNYNLTSVKYAVSAAAPLSANVQQHFVERFKSLNAFVSCFQMYGLTETSPLTHCMPKLEFRKSEKIGSVGVTLPNIQCKIVKSESEVLGPMCEGELIVKGPNIMKGYWNNQKATDQCLKDGWFYTGDLAYYDEDGYFFITGRRKELIKYKGLQVSPAEIEALLLSHALISDCAVIGKLDDKCGEMPMALIVKDGKNDLTEEAVVSLVEKHLSDHNRLRGGVVFVDEIPRSTSGKILRRLLIDKYA